MIQCIEPDGGTNSTVTVVTGRGGGHRDGNFEPASFSELRLSVSKLAEARAPSLPNCASVGESERVTVAINSK
jgi:hypothetical protein